jgi:glutamine amidotransferase
LPNYFDKLYTTWLQKTKKHYFCAMTVALIDYPAGNTQSVIYALNRLGIEPVLTDDASLLASADRVIFPGVGEASTAMAHLRHKGLDKLIPTLKQPFLGICLGMQLLCSHSEESDTECLGIIPQRVKLFPKDDQNRQKVPHMGWNTIVPNQNPLWQGLVGEPYFYFVHSYYVEASPYSIADAHYIVPFTPALQKDNFWAVQFHPEKSAEAGQTVLQNFLKR